MSNNNENTKKYTIQIADRTGHSTFADLSLEEAVNNILENVEQNARFVYINGVPFDFQGTQTRAEQNVQNLRTALAQADNAEVFLTGKLIGGMI